MKRRSVIENFELANDRLDAAMERYSASINFEDAQVHLKEVSEQWNLAEEAAAMRSSRVADIMTKILRNSVHKADVYGHSVSENLLRAAALLNPRTRLAKIQLPYTPQLVAIDCFEWMQRSLQTHDPVNPINILIKKMRAEIEIYYSHVFHQVLEDAQKQVFILIETYTSAMMSFIEEMCAAAQGISVAIIYTNLGEISSPELFDELRHQATALSVSTVVMESIIPKIVVPGELTQLIENLRVVFELTLAAAAPAGARDLPKQKLLQEKDEVARLVAHAKAAASYSGCGRNALSLMRAQLNLVRSIKACVGHNRLAIQKKERTRGGTQHIKYRTVMEQGRGKTRNCSDMAALLSATSTDCLNNYAIRAQIPQHEPLDVPLTTSSNAGGTDMQNSTGLPEPQSSAASAEVRSPVRPRRPGGQRQSRTKTVVVTASRNPNQRPAHCI